MVKVVFSKKADEEYNHSFLWYAFQSGALGTKFENAIQSTLHKIITGPELFGFSKKLYREASAEKLSFNNHIYV